MSQPGNPAGFSDQGNRFEPGNSGLGNVSRPVVAEIAAKRLTRIGNLTRFRQPVSQMLPPQCGPRKCPSKGFKVNTQAQVFETSDHRDDPGRSSLANLTASLDKVGGFVVHKMAQDMDFTLIAFGRQLDSCDQFEAQSSGLGMGDGDG
jgi:hypothetical protein